MACAVLVANNLRDIDGDRVSGKHTVATKLGHQGTRILYLVLVALACVGVNRRRGPVDLVGPSGPAHGHSARLPGEGLGHEGHRDGPGAGPQEHRGWRSCCALWDFWSAAMLDRPLWTHS